MSNLTPVDLSKLQAQLLNTGIQIKDNPLYQVIKQLIASLADINKAGGAAVSSITNIGGVTVTSIAIPNLDDGFSDDGFIIPGPAGADGANGMVPYFIAATEKFIIPEFKQALFSMNIDNEGDLQIDGFLIEVD